MDNKQVKFPYTDSDERLANYKHYDLLFSNKHFEAFKVKIKSTLYEQNYAKLKYVAVNFAALISKVSADMLFGEGLGVKVEDKELQKWLNNLLFENKMPTQLYESALINSRFGDDVFKVRSAPKNEGDVVSTVIIEEVRPDIYFPKFKNGNWRAAPEYQELAFFVTLGKKKYVRIERHYPGKIENELWETGDGGSLYRKAPLNLYDPTLPESQETGIDRSLIIHVPNWRAGGYFGVSDYADIESLMFALNNRMTANENVLDKHTEPILALPEGMMQADGTISKAALEVYTIPDNEMGTHPAKPEYITWNASLDNSFKQIEKLVEFLYMTSETSPGVFGMDKNGQAESGRALKLKLMRTIAKINRKKLYYDQAIKEALYVAQLLAKEHQYEVLGKKLTSEPEIPELVWSDGLPIDDLEQTELEAKKIEAGVQSKRDSIVKIDGLSEEDADKKLKRIKEEVGVPVPSAINIPPNPDANGDTQGA